ncbi:hypothetical protein F4556_005731 [Kitasatospora gansuensis]|uniref:Uncharacterized protein n=1 Tax=Kitasatospora gansuensis TaxID=258050 RepID=A0A7W7SGT1_9ACTN|nr:hypothetical protein [Kitasatospora gansuensis]MBB4950196.1 hypothetical protein [Kitasatospora gansuensis]
MAEITRTPGLGRPAAELMEDQLAGRACHRCGSAEAPLHPDEPIEVRVSRGVVRDVVTVLCTPCLVARR